ncbi:mechanosensitive ion channel family protein [Pseudalkalibacillus berkeleyi]|uniref:Mechanosensitive ion channel family protein n=1 Tax=Pseudalkalibacillus berkeleyi TaxID=1069813 RepID=A0ABS9H4I5_9BACL|nr:mechanosensitive ion channel family protein [Pseudalkalibacillus berkeleyi]MCF6139006.1 mechanosensitive ion channel family protein [Pseudalkalibacillus berkeleyi]
MLGWYNTTLEYVTDLDFWIDIGIALAIFIGFVLFRKLFTKYIFKLISRTTDKSSTQVLHKILLAFERPLYVFFIFLGLYMAYQSLEISREVYQVPSRLYRSSVILVITWGLVNLSSSSSILFNRFQHRLDLQVDQILIPFISRVLKFVIVAVSISVLAQEWGYNVNGFVAGLGIGGLAFALAAKESLSNLFGGIVIIIERPFSIGDWIQTPSVDGIVEDINFRSTKVRTFADALVTVPNANISNEAITNWTRMRKRRVFFNLGVTYTTPKDKLETCVKQIKTLLTEHKEVHPEFIEVRFDKYNDSSLDILIYFYTKTTAWINYLEVKEDINYRIMEILDREGVSVAFPSRSIYMEKEDTAESGEKE